MASMGCNITLHARLKTDDITMLVMKPEQRAKLEDIAFGLEDQGVILGTISPAFLETGRATCRWPGLFPVAVRRTLE